MKISKNEELKIIEFIAIAWSCTKSFWFLRPIDDYYLSKAQVNQGFEPWIERISSSFCS